MKQRLIDYLLVTVICLAAAGCAGKPQYRTLTYTNPLVDRHLADPCVIYENGYYYMFATGKARDGKGIQIYRSADLAEWEPLGGAVEPGGPEDWNFKHFWAPEVIRKDGRFYLYYTASPEGKDNPDNRGNRVGAAVADNIEGPYKDLGVVIPHPSIDGHPFTDDDGQMYMYYTIEYGNFDGLKAGNMYVDKMPALTSVAGDYRLIYDKYDWQEGPVMTKIDGRYILTFSQGAWTNDTYNVRYAVGDSPYGPFVEKGVVIESNEMVKGPGHHFLFKDESGNDWMAYHGWDTAYKARYPRIDPITITADTVYMDGPTYTAQEVLVRIN